MKGQSKTVGFLTFLYTHFMTKVEETQIELTRDSIKQVRKKDRKILYMRKK